MTRSIHCGSVSEFGLVTDLLSSKLVNDGEVGEKEILWDSCSSNLLCYLYPGADGKWRLKAVCVQMGQLAATVLNKQ